DDVRMMANHQRGPGVYSRMRKSHLRRGRLFHVFHTMMHRDDDYVGALPNRGYIPANNFRIGQRNARIGVFPIAVVLIEGVAEEAEPDAISHEYDAIMGSRFRLGTADRLDAVRTQPRDRKLHAMRRAISRVIIGGRRNIDTGELQPGN